MTCYRQIWTLISRLSMTWSWHPLKITLVHWTCTMSRVQKLARKTEAETDKLKTKCFVKTAPWSRYFRCLCLFVWPSHPSINCLRSEPQTESMDIVSQFQHFGNFSSNRSAILLPRHVKKVNVWFVWQFATGAFLSLSCYFWQWQFFWKPGGK